MMFENLPKYLAGARIGIKSDIAYRMDWVLFVAFQIVSPFVMIFVWNAIYAHTGVTTIGGFRLYELYAYFFVIGAAAGLSSLQLQGAMEAEIQSGSIAVSFTRPLGYVAQLVSGDLSGKLFAMAIVSVPILIIVTLVLGLHMSAALVLLFALELAIGYVIATLIGFIIGSLSVFFTDIGGFAAVVESVALLLGGAIVPFTMFPQLLVSIVSVLPFQFMFYVPAATFVGAISLSDAVGTFTVALVWILVLYVCAALLWNRARRSINAVGV